MGQAVVVGCGPAGVSAAIYIRRAGLEVTVVGGKKTALWGAEKIENYYGFAEPISGVELFERGICQAKRLGCEFVEDEVVAISGMPGFVVKTALGQELVADSVVLASGRQRATPNIVGLSEFEGRGVSYCAVCDAFFYRNKQVAVVGNGAYAVSEAKELAPVADVVILTNGAASSAIKASGLKYMEDELESICGKDRVESVAFRNGKVQKVDGVFVAVGFASSLDFAKKLGVLAENNRIVTDGKQATNRPGFFAAGDCCAPICQVAVAVAQGAVAGLSVVEYIRKLAAK